MSASSPPAEPDPTGGPPLRIVHVTPYYFPHVGGVETYVRNLALQQQAWGHDVLVLTSRHERGLPLQDTVDGVPVRRVPQRANLFATPITPKLAGVMRQEQADVVHLHAPPPLSSYYATKGTRGRQMGVVMTYHCDLEIMGPGGGMLTELYRRTLGRTTLRRTDMIVATSDSYAATSRAVWDQRPRIIPVGVELDRFHPDVPPAAAVQALPFGFTVLFVGRMTAHKGLTQLVEAIAALPKEVGAVIVGGGPRERHVRELIAELGVQDRIHLAGSVSNAGLPSYYGAADAFVLPSTSRLEAFGIATLEAMASAVPVVTSDMPGVRELVVPGTDGLLAQPFDSADLAAQLRRLYDDPQLRATLGRNARATVERRFSWPVITEQFLRLYRSVLQTKGATETTSAGASSTPAKAGAG